MTKEERAREVAIAADVEQSKSYFWCSCGKSSERSYYDGSHNVIKFNPVVYKAELTKKMFFCASKLTNNQPFYDS